MRQNCRLIFEDFENRGQKVSVYFKEFESVVVLKSRLGLSESFMII